MKRRKLFYRYSQWRWLMGLVLLISGSLSLTGCHGDSPSTSPKNRFIYNNDGTEILFNNWFGNRPLTIEDIHSYVDIIADNTQVTTFMMCSGSDFVYYRSKYSSPLGDDKGGELSCEDNDLNHLFNIGFQNFQHLEASGTDIIQVALERAKEKNLEAFITYRMNDLHFADTLANCPRSYSNFWRSHPEYWLGEKCKEGWNSKGGLDFSHQEVREHKLAMITEQLEKYPMIDGYELDFLRFPVFFKTGTGKENAPLMTQLVEQVRKKTDSLSHMRGKKILLAVRVPLTVENCLYKGLDIKDWVNDGLIDFITITTFLPSETALPIAQFRKELNNADIPIYGSVYDVAYPEWSPISHGMYRGIAAQVYEEGGQGVSLFNFFFKKYLEEGDSLDKPKEGSLVCSLITPDLLRELGSPETLKNRNKIYTVSDGISSLYGVLQHSQLPLAVSASSFSHADIVIGDDFPDGYPEEAFLFVKTDGEALFKAFIHDVALERVEGDQYPAAYGRQDVKENKQRFYAYRVPPDILSRGKNPLKFLSESGIFVILRAEIALKYGDTDTHGYF